MRRTAILSWYGCDVRQTSTLRLTDSLERWLVVDGRVLEAAQLGECNGHEFEDASVVGAACSGLGLGSLDPSGKVM